MNLNELIAGLSRTDAYPTAIQGLGGKPPLTPAIVDNVEVKQTHISVVFLVGKYVYKIKKPVAPGFLDYSTLEKRRHACEEEVHVNRRLAPSVYLGVVPVVRTASGLRVEAPGEPIEWAVKMVRLPDEASLLYRVEHGTLDANTLVILARRIAAFHSSAEGGPRAAANAHFEQVARNARENLDHSAQHVGVTVSQNVYARLGELLESELDRLHGLIDARASRGVARDTHGDLRLEHVYLFPERPTPDDLVIIDGIEFNHRFRLSDPVCDMSFLVMDLMSRGRADLARVFADAYFNAADDSEGRELLPLYVAYRAMVRAKVRSVLASEPEVPAAKRIAAGDRARANWLLALGVLENPLRAPCLVLIAGLPGTGKSTIARRLAQEAGFTVVRSDVIRKEIARKNHAVGIYTPEWDDRTYVECLRRAEQVLDHGGRVLVDANFREEGRRLMFLRAAARRCVPFILFLCRADAEIVRIRLAARRGDASDADWSIYRRVAKLWQDPGVQLRDWIREVPNDGDCEDALAVALQGLDDLLLRQSLRPVLAPVCGFAREVSETALPCA